MQISTDAGPGYDAQLDLSGCVRGRNLLGNGCRIEALGGGRWRLTIVSARSASARPWF